ncbi:MAG: 50S ribosomal protein L24 [Candidatus Woesearchaeota archaeon]|jgi:large subunit ribosomal protein L24|nr:50S ribosomal protein L24 [Candidatus Woesearchaeota archaeon]|tara:strand:- start:11060 stop:11440 length:381 start_codon:yes stop_codon:yes gene_type:complete
MKEFSKTWKSSKKPRKQRKYRLRSTLHIKQRLLHSHISKDLRKKFGKRSIGLRKGDKVRVMRGQFKKHEGKIEKIDLKKIRVSVSGIELTKKDGTKKLLDLHPSNLTITELNLDDKFRQKILDRTK